MLTDGEGHFEFALPKPTDSQATNTNGPYRTYDNSTAPAWFMARKPGYLDDPSGRMQQTASASGGTITIALVPEALIKGRALLNGGEATVGLNVQLLARQTQEGLPRWVHAGSTQANSQGEFRFAELAAGSYKVMTHEMIDNDPVATMPGGQRYGFPPVFFPGVADVAAAGIIEIGAGQTVQADIPLTREPYYPVRIPVVNPQSAGMNITVSSQGHSGPGYSLGYNAETQRIEGLLPNGSYEVEAAAYGQQGATGTVRISVAGAALNAPALTLVPDTSIRLHVSEEFTDQNRNGSSTWSVAGRTFNVHGPRSYLQVRLESADDFRPANGMLRPPRGNPDDEELVMENVQPGRYWLRIDSSRGYVAAATLGGVDLLHQPLVVAPGSGPPVEIRMRDDAAQLSGSVAGISTDSMTASSPMNGVPMQMPLAYVYCVPLPDSAGRYQELGMSSDGKFGSESMTPGVYRILAFKKPKQNLPYRDVEAMKAYESLGSVVHLAAGEKTDVQVPLISNE